MGRPGTNSRNGKIIEAGLATDSVEAAEEAGLQYVSDDRPGYESNVWRFRLLGRMSGFVHCPLVTFRRLVATRAAGSNTVITSAGASCAMKTNSGASPISPRNCQRFGGELLRTCGCLVCRVKRCSLRSFDCWSGLSFASAMKNTRAPISHLA